ncbi:aminotransferase class V-fold PLP-dependent enzyme [Pontimicrobium sp. SW4]|uniref:Aminotransferase class V-fold PLP-dependent enzyme n=1 Tax=Pontimicrobium sp. SW4 TaxID=3153519 RepID=A0AAU7BP85_9FLAO
MNQLKHQILSLQSKSQSLEPNEAQRNIYLEKVNAYANSFLNSIDTTNAYCGDKETPEIFKVTNKTKSIEQILELYANEVAAKGINAASGGHLGYIPGGGIYTSSLADYLVDVTNEYVGMHYSCPGGVAIEHELLNWMKSMFNFPGSAIGNLTSGGSIANLIALTAARDKHGIKNAVIEKSVIYTSPQVHHCIQKALRIIGLEDVQIRYLKLDVYSRIIASDLEQKIEKDKREGLNPFVVIASAGTTDTGAIDPLQAIGKIAKANNLWYHIDGAYGGFFILVDRVKERFEGIEMADSLVIDPHKGLFLPYGLGAVLVKDKDAVYHSNHYRANYMQDAIDDDMPVNPADVSPELTKHFRSLRMWLPLQLHGIEPFIACLEEKLLLTQYFREELVKIGFKVGPEPDLSVSYFWYPTNNDNENNFNETLLKELHNDGEIFLSSTLINGKFVIRMALLSFRTKLETIDKAIAMIERGLTKTII